MASRKRHSTKEPFADQLAMADPIGQQRVLRTGSGKQSSLEQTPFRPIFAPLPTLLTVEPSYIGDFDPVPRSFPPPDDDLSVQEIVAVAGPLRYRLNVERQLLRVRLVAILEVVRRGRVDMQEQMNRLIASMMPASAVPLPPQVLQARRNAVARDTLLREFGALNSSEIGELAGSKSPNRAALAHRWKSDGRIFAVPHQGTNYFPGFQFSRDGQPLPAVGNVVRLLAERLSPWELALWFTGRNGWLGGRRPVDLLGSEPADVVTAAEREAEERVF